jgi:nucleotide-binding universal stress UspA family protein
MTSMKRGSVVVGVDGSTGSDAAVTWAAQYAVSRHLPLLVVHGAGERLSDTQPFGHAESLQAHTDRAQEVTDRAVAIVHEVGPTLDLEVSAPLHDPREVLLDCAAKASMLVVGTRGFGTVRILLLGAVSAAVATHASCPVAVVRPPQSTPNATERHVVVGTDSGPASTAALELAFDLASVEGRALDVVHSYDHHEVFVDLSSYEERLRLVEEHDLMLSEALAGYAEKYPDVVVERHQSSESATHTLLRLSTRASTVVVGTRRRTGASAMLTSVSRDLVERAHCTVIVARP